MPVLIAAALFQRRVFLSPDSSIGFGLLDFIEFAAAAILLAFVLVWPGVRFRLSTLAERTRWCMLLIGVLPVALRLVLLPHCPVPTPSGSDDFAYILLGDTLRHFRFANPPHALPQFFAQIFVLQQPTYSSTYPPGQGMALALGWILFGHPWAGVLLSTGAFCSTCYWMLRGWTTPGWALLGGGLAVIEFGPLCYWMNCYWGGAVSATAGCLVFGALPRLQQNKRPRDAALLGLGLSMQLLTRPYEFVFLIFGVLLFFTPMLFRRTEPISGARRALSITASVVAGGALLMLLQNKQVTGNWTTLPYVLYRYQYGVPANFTFQRNAVPHREVNREEELDYRAQTAVHGPGTDTLRSYFERLVFRARFYRFFFLAPLYLALLAFVLAMREFKSLWIVLTLVVFALGTNFYPYFYPHYIAAITCLFVLTTVIGLKRLEQLRVQHLSPAGGVARILVLLCAAQFVFWYGVHLLGNEDLLSAIGRFETWNYINYDDPEGRIAIDNQLARAPGKHLVFVQYGPQHAFHEWVHNAAGIDAARVVWAHDLGATENTKLRAYYPDRTVWLVKPDARPPELVPYPSEAPAFQDVR
jgi:hypothetical protein